MKNFTKKSGFTLVEIMVAVSIFAVVAVIATGALITASDINKKAQAIKLAVDNVNFALNKMAFEVRNGNTYGCANSVSSFYFPYGTAVNLRGCPPHASGVTTFDTLFMYTFRTDCTFFRSQAECVATGGVDNDGSGPGLEYNGQIPVAYKLNVDANGRGEIMYSTNPSVPSSFFPITSPEVDIENLMFRVTHQGLPRVQVNISAVVAGGTKHETIFDLQTIASSRRN